MQIPDKIYADMQRMKSYFPYRIIHCCYNTDLQQWETWAQMSKRRLNQHLRKGYACFMLESEYEISTNI